MKKAISVLLALVMCLGMCACGTYPSAQDNATSMQNNTSQVDPKDAMLSSATELKCGTLYDDYDENELNAIDKYVGKAFTVTGYIYGLNTEYIQLTPFAPAIDSTTFEGCTVYLPTDDLKQVRKGQIVTVVGKISEYTPSSMFAVEMDEAYLVSNVIDITAKVGEITYFMDYDGVNYYYVPLTTEPIFSGQEHFAQEFWYKLGASDPGVIVINGVTVEPGDTVSMEISGEKNNEIFNKKGIYGEYVFPMFVNAVNQIEIVE